MARTFLPSLCCVLMCGAALAAPPPDRPCKADIDKYCGDARGDRDKMGQCMRAHFTDFSQACQDKMKEHAQAHGGAGQQHAPTTQGTTAPSRSGT